MISTFRPPWILRALLLAAAAAPGLHGATKFWDGATPINATTDGGTGTWDTANNWDATLDGANASWVAGDDAIFGGTAGTVTLAGPISAQSLTFNTTGYSVTGNTLTLTGTSVINTAPGVTAAVSSILAGTVAWSKTGAGTLILSGNNTYTGATTVAAGVLNLQHAGALGSGGAVSITSGAAIELQGGVTLSAHTLTIANPGTGVGGAGALRNISGNNTWSGAITLANVAAVYRINSDNGLLTLAGAITESGTANGKNLTFGGLGDITVSAGIQGTGSDIILTKDGTGTLTLTAGNTYNGGTVLTAGTIKLTGAGRLATAAVSVTGGTLDYGSVTDTVGAITLTGGTITSTTGVLTGASYAMQSGTVSAILGGGTGVALTKTTAGTVTLSGVNTYTGVTTISAGTLSVGTIGNGGVAGNLGKATNAAANLVLGGGTLRYTGAGAATNRNFTLTAATTSTIEVTTAATSLTISGASTATAGALTKTGAGTLTLSGLNLHTGATSVSAGTLNVTSLANGGGASALGASTNAAANLTIAGGATLAYAGAGAAATDRQLTLVGTGEATLANNGGGAVNFSSALALAYDVSNSPRTLTLAGSEPTLNTFAALIGDNGTGLVGLVKRGAGEWVLAHAGNTFTGGVNVAGGTLLVNGSAGSGAAVVADGATLGGSGSVGATTLNAGAFLSPGSTGTGGVGTFSALAFTWAGGGTGRMQFNLGAAGTSDRLAVSGAFTKSGSGPFMFDFQNTGSAGTYTLISASAVSGFSAADFAYTGLAAGLTGSFSFSANNLLFTALTVPEPSTYGLLGAGALAGISFVRRHRRA